MAPSRAQEGLGLSRVHLTHLEGAHLSSPLFLYNILLPPVDCFLHVTLVPTVPSTTVSDAAPDTGPVSQERDLD